MPRVVCPKCGHANSDLRERCVACKAKLPPSTVKPIGRTAASAAPAARKALKLSVSRPRPATPRPDPTPPPPKDEPPKRTPPPRTAEGEAPKRRPSPAPPTGPRPARRRPKAEGDAPPPKPVVTRPPAASIERLLQEAPDSGGVEGLFHREPRSIPRVQFETWETDAPEADGPEPGVLEQGIPEPNAAPKPAAPEPVRAAAARAEARRRAREDDRRWPGVRRLLLMLEAFPALAFAGGAAAYRRYDFLWVALAAGTLPLLYALAGAVRGRRGRGLSIVAALVMAIALGGSSFLVVRSCDNRLGPLANLAGCDLGGSTLAGLDLQGANLSGADLSGADLSHAGLGGADLSGADLREANLDGTDLSDADLSGADLRGARLDGATLARAGLADANLADLDLGGLDLSAIDLSRADLSRADLTGTDLTGGVLDRASLEGARLSRTVLTRASLREASLRGATIHESDFTDARLNGTILEGADLRIVSMVGTTGYAIPDLASALGVPADEIGRGLSAHLVRLQLRREVMGALGGVCRGGAVENAGQGETGALHPLAIVSEAGRPIPMANRALQNGWEPMALRYGELVACVAPEVATTVEVCPAGPAGASRRMQFTRHVRVVRARTAAVVLDRTYRGSIPRACPAEGNAPVRGSHVDFDALQADFTHLVAP